jgi:hypothetical protein
MFVLDSEVRSFELQNLGTELVRMNLHFVSNQQSAPPFVPPPV